MICHLPADPLQAHARHVLLCAKDSSNSWFIRIRDLCLLYGLDHPLKLLSLPPSKYSFKRIVKKSVALYWENLLKAEAADLPSLCYFMADNCSVQHSHYVWTTARSSFECRKASVLARMMSGRFRSEYLTRHWSNNKQGFCLAETCTESVGDLEHMLLQCPALSSVRARMWDLMFQKSVAYPPLLSFFLSLEKSPPKTQIQFFLDPTAFHEIIETVQVCGQPVFELICYLTRTFVYYLYREKQILVGWWRSDNLDLNNHKKHSRKRMNEVTNLLISGSEDVEVLAQEPCAENCTLSDHLPAITGPIPVVTRHDRDTVLRGNDAVAVLPGLTGSGLRCESNAPAKNNRNNLHGFHALTICSENDRAESELPPCGGLVGVCGGGGGVVSGVAKTTFT